MDQVSKCTQYTIYSLRLFEKQKFICFKTELKIHEKNPKKNKGKKKDKKKTKVKDKNKQQKRTGTTPWNDVTVYPVHLN